MLSTSLFTPSRRSRRPDPWLVCMDLQREYVVPGRPLYAAASGTVADACVRVLAQARQEGWRVVHTQLRRREGLFASESLFGAPIEGLRPLISEPVFLRGGLSAFSNADFAAEMREARGEEVFLIGFSLTDTCLATVFAAVDQGVSLTLVEDAVGAAPTSAARTAPEIARAILSPYVRFVASHDLEANSVATLEYPH